MSGFAGKVALVAGGGSGMGRRIAERLAGHGARIAVADLKAHEAPGDWITFQGDLTDERFVASSVADIVDRFNGIDYLVNSVGVLWFDRDRSFLENDADIWDRVFAVNVKALALTARHVAPHMKTAGKGAMVHFSSTDALSGDPSPQDAYGASKAAVIRLSRSIAVQLAPFNIRSNCVLPGLTMTPMQQRFDGDPEKVAAISRSIPLGRFGTVDDQAAAALFLLSDEASYITGTELVVDGGSLALPS